MQRSREKTTSTQLSLFDTFEPETLREEPKVIPELTKIPEPEIVPEPEIIPEREIKPEPEIVPTVESNEDKHGDTETRSFIYADKQEQEEEAEDPGKRIRRHYAVLINKEVSFAKPNLTTEEILKPMVIYFNNDEAIPAEEAEEKTPPVLNLPEAAKSAEPEVDEDEVDLSLSEPEKSTVKPLKMEETAEAVEVVPEVETIVSETVEPEHEPVPAGRKILITGASGFIGGYLVQEALDRGYEVWAGVREGSSRRRLADERIRFIQLSYDDPEALSAQLSAFREEHGAWDYVIHNAGLTKTLDKKEFFRVNAEYTYHLLEALHTADCSPRKFLLMSSLSSYGRGDEKGFTPIHLDDPQQPDTSYGLSKLEAENYVRRQTYFPYIILRPTGVYGPGDKDYFMEIKSIQSGFDFTVGMTPQKITFIYVKDLARVAFMALEKEEIRNKHYFVADGDVYTDHSFAQMIQEILGIQHVVKARVPTGLVYIACLISETMGRLTRTSMTLNTDKYKILKQRNWICDIQPLKEDLGFVAEYPLRRGLEEAIAWYRENKWL